MLPFYYKHFINSVFYLLQVFALFFPFDFINFSLYEGKFWTVKQIYAVCVSVLLILSYAYLEWLQTTTSYKVIRTSSIILIILTHTSLTSICLICTLGNVFWNREKWRHYLKLHKILRSKLQIRLRRNKLYFALEVILGHFAFFVVAAVDQWRHYLYFNGSLMQITAIALKDALFYYIFLITAIIYNAALHLRNDFCAVKTYLSNSLNTEADKIQFSLFKPLGNDLIFPTLVIGDKTLYRLLEASKILNILFECVEIFNHIFGAVILLMNFSTVLIILSALNMLLINGEENLLTVEVVLNCLCESTIFMLWNSFIVSACGLLKKECELVVKLCCKLQHLLPQSSQERKELLNLANQIHRKSPTISASGFFDIDFFVIFCVFTYVGTYIVVLIQFSRIDF